MWAKWGFVKDISPFKIGNAAVQTPGIIPSAVLEELQGIVDELPAKIKYPALAENAAAGWLRAYFTRIKGSDSE